MKRVLAILPLALLAAVLVPSPVLSLQDPDEEVQDPPEEGDEEEEAGELQRDIYGRLHTREIDQGNGIRGMWQLLDMDLEGYPPEGLVPSGYLLLADGFMSFQLHAFYDETVLDFPMEDGYQTFMAEYEVLAGDQLKCTTLIGSYFDEEEGLSYEPAGIAREFVVERKQNLLVLRWDDSNRMTFGRRLPPSQRLKDIYGKDRGERSRRGPDIYGREGVTRPGKGDEKKDDDGDDGD